MRERRYRRPGRLDRVAGSSSVPHREEGAVPERFITIDREQREGLYELVRNHISSIEDRTSGSCGTSAGASTTPARATS